MRVSGSFTCWEQFSSRVQRPQAHAEARESVGSSLLAVDDADRVSHLETLLPQGRDGLQQRAA